MWEVSIPLLSTCLQRKVSEVGLVFICGGYVWLGSRESVRFQIQSGVERIGAMHKVEKDEAINFYS
jgi:hypothetical protein